MEEVRGSIPLSSTTNPQVRWDAVHESPPSWSVGEHEGEQELP